MPFITLKTNKNIDEESKKYLKNQFGNLITLLPGKSEEWLMVSLDGNLDMYFKGTNAPLCMVEVKTYGENTKKSMEDFTSNITVLVSKVLNIKPERIYISYFSTPNWGFDGSNF